MKFHKVLILTFFAYTLISCGGAEERKSVHMQKALSSIEDGDLEKARIELKNVLQIDPKEGEAYYQLGSIYEQKKKYRKAYKNYLKAEELNPELLSNHARLGRFYLLLMNDTDKAQEKVDLILSKEVNNADGLLLKAVMMQRNENLDGAVELAKNIVFQNPNHIESVTFLASLYVKNKKKEKAVQTLDSAVKINPNNKELNKLLAMTLVVNKNYERAEAMYKGFLEKNPNKISSYTNLAAFYTQIDNKPKAEEILRASVKNDSSDENRILLLIKYIKVMNGEKEAINALNLFVSENKGSGQLRVALGDLHMLSGDNEAAIKVFKQAVNDFSDEVTGINARRALSLIYAGKKEYEKASEITEEALLISPNDPDINYLRAKFAARDKDMEKAIISLRVVTKEAPENIEAFFLLASIYEQEGNEEQSKRVLNSAYEKNKLNSEGLLKLASYYFGRDVNQAEKIIDNYIKIKPSSYEGLSIKAMILNQKKQESEAYNVAKKIIDSYPDKENGYLQAVPYYVKKDGVISVIPLLEKGYINAKDNRKILTLLTSLQVKQQKFDVVEKRLNAELNSSPKDTQIKIMLAKVHLVKKETGAAETLLKSAITENSGVEELYLLLANIYQSKKDLKSTKATLISGRTNIKSSLKISIKLASMYENEKSYKKSLNIYQNLYEIYPNQLMVANNLASMLSDYGNGDDDLEKAKVVAEKLKDSNQPVFFDTVGWVYYKLGDHETAIKYLARTIEEMPDVSIFNYHLGMAYKLSGDKTKAKYYLEKSISNNKKFKQMDLAKAALRDL